MTTLNQNNWDERDERSSESQTEYNTNHIVDRNSGNDDDWDEEDDLSTANDDLDETDTVGNDADADYDTLDDEEGDFEDGTTNSALINDGGPSTFPGQPNTETPEREESENESLGYPNETEFTQPDNGNDASFSEQTDVTPPRPHEFPSVGNPQTDFSSRVHGRSTGRMIGHEPGTEGI